MTGVYHYCFYDMPWQRCHSIGPIGLIGPGSTSEAATLEWEVVCEPESRWLVVHVTVTLAFTLHGPKCL